MPKGTHTFILGNGGNMKKFLVVAGVVVLLACAPVGRRGWVQYGLASWYGPGFHGKRTASGEIFNMYKLTAAHNFLPFGTIVEVTNLTNGKKVRVRINDRGPSIKGRIIDLSYAAAKKIDLIGPGVAKVRLRVIRWGTRR